MEEPTPQKRRRFGKDEKSSTGVVGWGVLWVRLNPNHTSAETMEVLQCDAECPKVMKQGGHSVKNQPEVYGVTTGIPGKPEGQSGACLALQGVLHDLHMLLKLLHLRTRFCEYFYQAFAGTHAHCEPLSGRHIALLKEGHCHLRQQNTAFPNNINILTVHNYSEHGNALFLLWLALPFKTANFEPQYLTCFKINLNAISQVYYNGNRLVLYEFLYWYVTPFLCYGYF